MDISTRGRNTLREYGGDPFWNGEENHRLNMELNRKHVYKRAFLREAGFVRFLFLPCANALALLRSRPNKSSFLTS